ncbi:uncharacterized protein LOC127434237 [Myxocyprinus asiaticus]|uniref:uncharacterized protein LOC127434237 n=1 Tax=Myxocyprinus asiaticus TaxID=70543 RepID=UPI002222DDCC|nr:uncharacterized protein LOC127434237 [Myxocyprinus asiaticus]XP_051542776.1 uncharacterized protein LOC127434237 [Myxocyprinus asiaticus]
MPSSIRTLLPLVYVLCAFPSACSGDIGDARPCSGSHCLGSRTSRPPRQYNPTTQSRSINQHAHSSFHSEHHAALSPSSQRGRSGDQARETLQTRVAEVFGSVCADCVTPQRAAQITNDTRECKGIECRLPLRIRPKPPPRPCAGDGCVPGTSQPPLMHVADRAAQFLGEFPDIGYPASEQGAPLGVQLTCDIKPGENEVPAEDALILHLQLTKGQEKLVETLRAQQVVIRDLQQRLVEQQGALLSQQREILDQQHRMYEQMDVVKAQYGLLSETVKQVSFQGLQGELQNYFESHLAGLQNQARSHLQKSYAVHKVDVDAKLMDVVGDAGHPLLGCQVACGPEEYCNFQKDPLQCERCTMCPPGFFLVSQCSPTADRMCQDRDECLELPSLCGERVKCLNTPGGFRCLGVSEREISAGLCGLEYFYNLELQECQACSGCDGEPVAIPCTVSSDSVCGTLSENTLTRSWAASIAVMPTKLKSMSIYPGIQLNIRGKERSNLLTNHDGYLNLQLHGLLWIDHNFALKHSCRNFLQVGMRLNGSEEEGHDLSGVRIDQPERKFFQGVTVSAAVEVEPNHTLAIVLKSPNQHCNQSKDLQMYDLGDSSFSLLWLSHDTGAVAMTAQMSTAAHYQSNYRPTFRMATVSDPYIVALTHDSRGVRFMENGVVKFVLQQAIYSMGHPCVREGFFLIAYVNRNGTNQEVMRSFKSGVNYRDTSITLSGATRVDNGDWLNFEIVAPSQCSVRYFGDSSGISMLSLIWIPTAVSSTLMATVSRTGLPSGAVRNKPLLFRQMSPNTDQIRIAGSSEPHAQRNFVFSEAGMASVAINLKLIHSCNVVKLTLHRQGKGGHALAQQVGGHMPEGSEWASIGLRTSFDVLNGTAIYVSLDCIRGRINQITHEGGTNISILWLAS